MTDRKTTARAVQQRRLQFIAEAVGIKGGGHNQQPQLRPQQLLTLMRQCQRQVGMQVTLVEFIENNQADTVKLRIILQHAGKNTFGDHLNPGSG